MIFFFQIQLKFRFFFHGKNINISFNNPDNLIVLLSKKRKEKKSDKIKSFFFSCLETRIKSKCLVIYRLIRATRVVLASLYR